MNLHVRGRHAFMLLFFYGSCFSYVLVSQTMIYIMRLFMVYIFYLCFVKTRNLFWFTCIFHTCIYGLFSVSGIYRLIHSKLLSTFATDR